MSRHEFCLVHTHFYFAYYNTILHVISERKKNPCVGKRLHLQILLSKLPINRFDKYEENINFSIYQHRGGNIP